MGTKERFYVVIREEIKKGRKKDGELWTSMLSCRDYYILFNILEIIQEDREILCPDLHAFIQLSLAAALTPFAKEKQKTECLTSALLHAV
jgi:hypothetical protein